MTARRLLRLTHGWIGAVAALFLLLVSLSGAALAFMSEMFLAQYGEMLEAEPPASGVPPADLDRLVEGARAGLGVGFEPMGVLMPHSRVPGVGTAMLYGSRADDPDAAAPWMLSIDPWTGEYKGAFRLDHAFGHDLIDFHYSLFAGDAGAAFVAVLGLLLALFALTGLWLWWPRDGRVGRKARPPRLSGKRKHRWFALHGWVGVWLALPILFFGVTGSATSQPGWFGPLLAHAPHEAPPSAGFDRRCGSTVTAGDAARLAAERFPGHRLTMLDWPHEAGDPFTLYLHRPGDLDAMEGDTLLLVHASCPGLTHAFDLREHTLPERLESALLSLHGGYSFGPLAGPALVVLTGLALGLLSATGIYVFLTRTLKLPLARRELPAATPANLPAE